VGVIKIGQKNKKQKGGGATEAKGEKRRKIGDCGEGKTVQKTISGDWVDFWGRINGGWQEGWAKKKCRS